MTDIWPFMREMMVRPALRDRRVVFRIVASLIFLSVAQGLMLFLVKGFLTAFFADPTVDVLTWGELLPSRFHTLLGHLADTTMPKSTLAWVVPVGIVIAGAAKAFAGYWYTLSQQEVALRVAQEYRERMFEAILRLPWLSSTRRTPGEWMSVIMADAVFLQTRLTDLLTGFVKDGVLILACLGTLLIIHWPSALVLGLVIPVIAKMMGKAGKRIAFFAEAFQKELGFLAGTVLEMRGRFRYIKSQSGEAFEQHLFDDANDKYLRMMTSSIFLRAFITPAMEWVGFALFAGFLWAWTRGWLGAGFTPEVAIQFFVALGILLRPSREMGEQFARWQETMGGLRRSMMVMQEVTSGGHGHQGEHFRLPAVLRRHPMINIDRIKVKYGDRVAFSAQDVGIASGRAVAIIGSSGAGKSTLLKALAGLIEPAEWAGSCRWREAVSQCAFVSQQPFLFQDTLRANLLYGLESEIAAETTDEMLWGALAVVNLADDLRALPLRLQTVFNPIGHNFSGGQIQRMVVARALLRRRSILLLDEATSAVDGATERDMTTRLIETVHDSGTVLFVVTHRMRWLHLYDDVYFIRDGVVAARGPHKTLMGDAAYSSFVTAEESRLESDEVES